METIYNPFKYMETMVYKPIICLWKLWFIQPLYKYGNYGLYNPFIHMETLPFYVYGNYYVQCIQPLFYMETMLYSVYNPLMYLETMVYTTLLCIWKLWCIQPF